MVDKLLAEVEFQVKLVAWKMPNDAVVPAKPENYKTDGRRYVVQLSQQLDVPISFAAPAVDTHLAHVATKIADTLGIGFAYSRQVFNQKWLHAKDISDPQVLTAAAASLGINLDEFRNSLQSERFHLLVEADYKQAAAEKIWTIPAYQVQTKVQQIHHFQEMPTLEQLKKFIQAGELFIHESK